METPKRKILFVDDDPMLLQMWEVKFSNSGRYEVIKSPAPLDALKKLRDGVVPDIILSDVVLPVMDGIEFFSTIKKEGLVPQAKLGVLSNQNQESDITRASKIGVSIYIVKSETIPSALLEKVDALFAQ
jgi:CheY-like chemotaxis protein